MPIERERAARLDAVLQVLYLVFNEGYASSSGRAVHRVELANEAIRLTRDAHADAAGRSGSRRVCSR